MSKEVTRHDPLPTSSAARASEWVSARVQGNWHFGRIKEFTAYGKEFVECTVFSGFGATLKCHYPELVFHRHEFYGEEK